MRKLDNESGSVLVFITLMIVLLMVMVGMGLDTGQLTFTRATGQRAVDAAALAGAAAAATGDTAGIKKTIEGLTNDYLNEGGNPINGTVGGPNVMLVRYDKATQTIVPQPNINLANAVRVSLENKNPDQYGGATVGKAINSPLFLTPFLNLLGLSTPGTANVNVSAVATYRGMPGIPLALGGCTYGQNQEIPFDQSPSSEGGNNSGWTTYEIPETNTPDIVARIKKIVNCQGGGVVEIGDPICLGNGTQPPVIRAFDELVDPTGNTCYIAPVVDPINVFNKCDQPVRAWANICIKAVCAPPDSKSNPACTIKNKKYVLANVDSCNVDLNAPNVSQCYATRLVRDVASGM